MSDKAAVTQVPPANISELFPGEQKRIDDALDALAKDPHAPREISVRVRLHIHHEYPKSLFKGKASRIVNSATEEKAAVEDGFGAFVPEAPEE